MNGCSLRRFGIVFALVAALLALAWLPRFGQTAAPAQQLGSGSYLPLVFQAGEAATLTATARSLATRTPNGTFPPTITHTPSATPSSQLVAGGDFEGTTADWIPRNGARFNNSVDPPPHRGSAMAVFPLGSNGASMELKTSTGPPAGKPTLSYWVWIESDAPTCGFGQDEDWIAFELGGDMVGRFPLCKTTATTGWVERTMQTTGQSGVLIVRAYTPSYTTRVYVDDIGFK